MSKIGNVGLASLLAGPIFVLSAVVADLYLQLPAPIVIEPQSVLGVLGVACLAMPFGAVVALPVTALGAFVMLALGGSFPLARTRAAWALAGGLLGALAVGLMGLGPQFGFAVVATSVFCAWICSWSDVGIQGD